MSRQEYQLRFTSGDLGLLTNTSMHTVHSKESLGTKNVLPLSHSIRDFAHINCMSKIPYIMGQREYTIVLARQLTVGHNALIPCSINRLPSSVQPQIALQFNNTSRVDSTKHPMLQLSAKLCYQPGRSWGLPEKSCYSTPFFSNDSH